jgi:DNA-binding MarR family transcriptional regulator
MKGLNKDPRTIDDRSPVVVVDIPCACAAARRAARALTQLYDGHLRASQVEATQFTLLAVLGSGDSFSQATLGRRFALDKTTLSRNLRLLKNKGWITIAPATDGRERRYVLTAAGRNRLDGARPGWRRAQAALRSVLSEREWRQMFRAFRLVTEAAHAARGER